MRMRTDAALHTQRDAHGYTCTMLVPYALHTLPMLIGHARGPVPGLDGLSAQWQPYVDASPICTDVSNRSASHRQPARSLQPGATARGYRRFALDHADIIDHTTSETRPLTATSTGFAGAFTASGRIEGLVSAARCRWVQRTMISLA
jgi:hypothetical protein